MPLEMDSRRDIMADKKTPGKAADERLFTVPLRKEWLKVSLPLLLIAGMQHPVRLKRVHRKNSPYYKDFPA